MNAKKQMDKEQERYMNDLFVKDAQHAILTKRVKDKFKRNLKKQKTSH